MHVTLDTLLSGLAVFARERRICLARTHSNRDGQTSLLPGTKSAARHEKRMWLDPKELHARRSILRQSMRARTVIDLHLECGHLGLDCKTYTRLQ
jgi:hypothetical protein